MIFPLNSTDFEFYWSLCVAGILVIWFLASIIHQFRFQWWNDIARFDLFNVLPRWCFFAPNPGRYDLHLVYRTWTAHDPGPWIEIKTTRFNKWRWVWNPSRYCNKGICDLVNNLYHTIQVNRDYPRSVILSGPYISLLFIIMRQPSAGKNAMYRQFAIAATQGFHENRTVEIKYISEIHRVDT